MDVDPLWEEFREQVAVSCLDGRHGNISRMRGLMYREFGIVRVCMWCGRDLPADRRRTWCKDTLCGDLAIDRYHWEGKRRRLLRDSDYRRVLCSRCGEHRAQDLHHILPISDGGNPFDEDNLTALCNPCHIKVHQEITSNKDTKASRKRKKAAEKAQKDVEQKLVFQENVKRTDEYWEQFGGIV